MDNLNGSAADQNDKNGGDQNSSRVGGFRFSNRGLARRGGALERFHSRLQSRASGQQTSVPPTSVDMSVDDEPPIVPYPLRVREPRNSKEPNPQSSPHARQPVREGTPSPTLPNCHNSPQLRPSASSIHVSRSAAENQRIFDRLANTEDHFAAMREELPHLWRGPSHVHSVGDTQSSQRVELQTATRPSLPVPTDPHFEELLRYPGRYYSHDSDIQGGNEEPTTLPAIQRRTPSARTNSAPSHPCPYESPRREYVRGESSAPRSEYVRGESSAPSAGNLGPNIFQPITPVGEKDFDPPEITDLIGIKCIALKWEVGWTTLETVPQSARDIWFRQFQNLATWDAHHNLTIHKIFFKKCRSIISNGWYNLRKARSLEGPCFASPEAQDWALEFFRTDPTFLARSARNKKNCHGKGDNPLGHSRHRGGRRPSFKHKRKLAATLKTTVLVYDLYKHLKIKPDGTYLDKDGPEIEAALAEVARTLRGKYPDQPVPEAEDLEMSAPHVGYSQRTGFPKVLGSAAALIPGSRYHSMSIHSAGSSQSQAGGSSSDVAALLSQMSQRLDEMQRASHEIHVQHARELAALARAVRRSTDASHIHETDDDDPDVNISSN